MREKARAKERRLSYRENSADEINRESERERGCLCVQLLRKRCVCCSFGTNKFVSCLFTSISCSPKMTAGDDYYVDLGRNWSWIVDIFGYRRSLYSRLVRLLSSSDTINRWPVTCHGPLLSFF